VLAVQYVLQVAPEATDDAAGMLQLGSIKVSA
jgi:hypothetical protein